MSKSVSKLNLSQVVRVCVTVADTDCAIDFYAAPQRERLEPQIRNMIRQQTYLAHFQRPFVRRHFSFDGNEEPDSP